MTRRVLLGTGAAVVVAGGALAAGRLTGRLDDAADAVGLDPKPLPDPADTTIIGRAAFAMAGVLAAVEATAAAHADLALAGFEAIGREHLEALGGTTASTDVAAPPTDRVEAVKVLEAVYGEAVKGRADDAADAFSADLVQVLASMSAGLAQCLRAIRSLR